MQATRALGRRCLSFDVLQKKDMDEAKEINAKEAAQIAASYLRDMLPEADNLLLEEVDKTTHVSTTRWLITISFQFDPRLQAGGIAGFQRAMGKREYKILTVDAETREVISMKIRDV